MQEGDQEGTDEKSGWPRMRKVSPLDPADLAKVVERALPGCRARSSSWIPGGLSNSNYRVVVEGLEETFVLRLHDRDPTACRKEAALHRFEFSRAYREAGGILSTTWMED